MNSDQANAVIAATDERNAIIAYLRKGGDYSSGVWYAWDREMAGYAAAFAQSIWNLRHKDSG